MSASKIVFPAPPPTSNTLTVQQRSQLLRTTKKLGRVLGSTPQFVDAAYDRPRVLLPFRDEPYPFFPHRASLDSVGASSSSSSLSRSPSTSRSASPLSITSYATSVRSDNSSARSGRSGIKSTRLPKRPPLLRLSPNSHQPTLATIPASPAPAPPIYARFTSSFADLSEADATRLYEVVNPAPEEDARDPRDSLIEPDFFIPSQSTLRRQKMERLRRKLGDGVPIDLVFTQTARPDVQRPCEITIRAREPRLTPPPPPPPTPASPVISSQKRSPSRDSLVLPTVHRAPRCKRVPVPAYEPEQPAESAKPPSSGIEKIVPSDSKRSSPSAIKTKALLRAIIESPDEHSGGCSEEFGLADALLLKYAPSTTGHAYSLSGSPYVTTSAVVPVSTEGVSVKLFSTRRGYEGWAMS